MPPARTPDPGRAGAEEQVLDELETWRLRAAPDGAAPLDADDLVRLLRDCFAALGLERAIAAGFTVNTVHYYRRKDIIDPPAGRTLAARYGLHHLWQIAGARLAGHLGLVTLAEARAVIRGANDQILRDFLAARVADARARLAVRADVATAPQPVAAIRPLSGAGAPSAVASATVITLPGDAWCVVPASHAAHHSSAAARDLARALAAALRGDKTP